MSFSINQLHFLEEKQWHPLYLLLDMDNKLYFIII